LADISTHDPDAEPWNLEDEHPCVLSLGSVNIELYSESLDDICQWNLSWQRSTFHTALHTFLMHELSPIDAALMMIETHPAALQHQSKAHDRGYISLEGIDQCRALMISKCIEQYPESLAEADHLGRLPLHLILMWYVSSLVEPTLSMIETYPKALKLKGGGYRPIHIECKEQCRSAIISKCIELYPRSLGKADRHGYLPLHRLLENRSSLEDALMMIEKYPAALRHQNNEADFPLHLECIKQCRSTIISKCIELYPRSLRKADRNGRLPLHSLLQNKSSSIDDALMMIEKYPAALQHRRFDLYLPIHIECSNRCRSAIISKGVELFPESLNDMTINLIVEIFADKMKYKILCKHCVALSIIFTARPMSLYRELSKPVNDIRREPHIRRRILHLLPRHVFTPKHESDYRDLNWQSRAAMMAILSQVKIQQQQQQGSSLERNINTDVYIAAALVQPSIMEGDDDAISSSDASCTTCILV
jgi:hypothetical protein